MKRYAFLLVLFGCALLGEVHAKTITVPQQTISSWQKSSAPLVYVFCDKTYLAVDYPSPGVNTLIIAGSPNNLGVFKKVTCTLLSGTVTIPTFTIPSTIDGQDATDARLSFYLYDGASKAKIGPIGDYVNLAIPDFITSATGCSPVGTCATFSDLKIYNNGSPIQPTQFYYTKREVDQKLLAIAGLPDPGSNGIILRTALNTTGVIPIGTGNQLLGVNSGASANEYKTLAVGTSGSDFAIAHGAGTVTFNLPTASGSNRGALASADWTTFNNKFTNSVSAISKLLGRGDSGAPAAVQEITLGTGLTMTGTTLSVTAGGTTINPGDTFLPYRLNSTTFADSPIARTGANIVTIGNVGAFAGLQIQGNASGSGVTLTALGGTNENIILTPKGTGKLVLPSGDIWGSTVTGVRFGTSGTDTGIGSGLSDSVMGFKLNGQMVLFLDSAGSYLLDAKPLAWRASIGGNPNTAIIRNADAQIQINNGTPGQWGSLFAGVRDAGTTTVTSGLTLGHQSTGTPAAGLGGQVLWNLNTSTTPDQNAGAHAVLWTDATHATRTADHVFYNVLSAAALAETFRIKANGNVVGAGNAAFNRVVVNPSSFTYDLNANALSTAFLVGAGPAAPLSINVPSAKVLTTYQVNADNTGSGKLIALDLNLSVSTAAGSQDTEPVRLIMGRVTNTATGAAQKTSAIRVGATGTGTNGSLLIGVDADVTTVATTNNASTVFGATVEGVDDVGSGLLLYRGGANPRYSQGVGSIASIKINGAFYRAWMGTGSNANARAFQELNDAGAEIFYADLTGNIFSAGVVLLGTNPAQSGQLRIPNNTSLSGRNAANSADFSIIKLNAANEVEVGINLINQVANPYFQVGTTAAGWLFQKVDADNRWRMVKQGGATGGAGSVAGEYLSITSTGISSFFHGAAVASAATITVTGNLIHVTGTTNITSVSGTGIAAGTTIVIIFDGVLTFTDGSNLKLAGNFVTTADDTITLTYDGTNWFEVARAVN